MNDSEFIHRVFISNDRNQQSQAKKLFTEWINLLIDTASDSNLMPQSDTLPINVEIPKKGHSTDHILSQLYKLIQPSIFPYNTGYIAHMDSIPTLFSILGELTSSFLNNNMLSVEMSPVFTRLENEVVQQIAALFGYSNQSIGTLLSGGTLANLQALTVARNKKFQAVKDGITDFQGRPLVFASEIAHTSVQKAAMILGLGTSSVVGVGTNVNGQMDVGDLEFKIIKALQEGERPFAVIATAGTTVTGNIDPIEKIVGIGQKYGLWVHVDAAYGGSLIFSEKYKHKLKGIHNADSITFNPQKWLYVAKTCAMVLFKNKEDLHNHFRISAPYMNESEDINLGEISVQGTRHAEILKLWLSIQHIGQEGYQKLIDYGINLAEDFVYEIKQRSFLEMASQPELNICCFRGIPEDGQGFNEWNNRLQQYLMKEIGVSLSLPLYKGERWLRAVLLNPFTERSLIKHIFRKVDDFYLLNKR